MKLKNNIQVVFEKCVEIQQKEQLKTKTKYFEGKDKYNFWSLHYCNETPLYYCKHYEPEKRKYVLCSSQKTKSERSKQKKKEFDSKVLNSFNGMICKKCRFTTSNIHNMLLHLKWKCC